ncbi:hypothetical protein Pint_19579 [Pistacia integerrima]|uniref:Uncharacterized protein n=1 Tax=Pistacia integerrima TaxID=434235 RepID=A0ACC0XF48_9ROSI|nr:hypothetical protein Pint_19579 [Pistacia integerrima]
MSRSTSDIKVEGDEAQHERQATICNSSQILLRNLYGFHGISFDNTGLCLAVRKLQAGFSGKHIAAELSGWRRLK